MKKKFLIIIPFLYILSFLIVINFKAPLVGEDFALSIPYSQKVQSFVTKLNLVEEKIITQSTTWNARLGEQLAILFLAFDKSFFNIFNIIIILIFFYLILTYAEGMFPRINLYYIYLLTLLISVFLLTPLVGDMLFWVSVASNYLWSVSLLLIFFLPYRLWYSGEDIFKGSSILRLFFIPLSFLAGMTNENTVFAIIIMIIAGFLLSKSNNPKSGQFPFWYWQYAFFLLAGYIFLLISPSTNIRREYYSTVLGIQNLELIDYVVSLENVIKQYVISSKSLIFLVLIFITTLIITEKLRKPHYNKVSNNNLRISLFLTTCSFVSVLILIAAPYFESRSLLLNWFFLLTLAVTTINNLFRREQKTLLLTIPFLIMGLVQTTNIYNCYSNLNEEANKRHYSILTQLDVGSRDIKVNRYLTECPNIFSNREDWLVEFLHDEIYYEVDHIIITKQ